MLTTLTVAMIMQYIQSLHTPETNVMLPINYISIFNQQKTIHQSAFESCHLFPHKSSHFNSRMHTPTQHHLILRRKAKNY